ncbi:DUF4365 domain-containing protein [Photobacterium sp. 1_MG-2023]|uniref:DUF4365 domain-containing protein n=1 Tax=Photobacterium sp. 1_MG-2023 TaxID=3062646 RepID=UPI0026E1E593|nr:DUF4365 domain-containing protein [Photobacterium sp. 1_MG-2023]MDO6707962.1 DUF4365 domain-containing protein [Photobacterium sp. 1_MG-2023]
MEYTRKNRVGDAGEYYFAYHVTQELRWPCRLLDVDLGIDAQIEVLDEQQRVTGKFVLAQVKTTSNGARSVSIKKKHFEYWGAIKEPVILVFVDLDSQDVFYKAMTKSYIDAALNKLIGDSLSIKFDSSDTLDLSSGSALRKLSLVDPINIYIKKYKEIEISLDKLDNIINCRSNDCACDCLCELKSRDDFELGLVESIVDDIRKIRDKIYEIEKHVFKHQDIHDEIKPLDKEVKKRYALAQIKVEDLVKITDAAEQPYGIEYTIGELELDEL